MKLPDIKKLKKIDDEHAFSGVCAGFGYWLGIPSWIIRLLVVVSFFYCGYVIAGYFLLAFFMPEYEEIPEDYEN